MCSSPYFLSVKSLKLLMNNKHSLVILNASVTICLHYCFESNLTNLRTYKMTKSDFIVGILNIIFL